MERYHIRIDGEQSTDSYTYQELVDMGLFELAANDLDGIEVKKITKPNFTPLRSYCFSEKQKTEGSYYVDEFGQIHRRTTRENNNLDDAYVDEFGQIVRPNSNIGGSSSGTSSSYSTNSSASTTSSSSSSNSSNSDGWTMFRRIIGTIIVIGFVIAIVAWTNGYGTPIVYGGYLLLKEIWDWD